ncbi:MAG: hypothetical protein B7733_22370 [Myxococcales bacterium FL481]|nr:MAG: hypothetical protein B7733_22370 [Myxococcales bacterium FL481]
MGADTGSPGPAVARWRIASLIWGVGLVAAVAWPMTWDGTRDSFPLSSYPMFTKARSQVTSYSMRAVSTGGQRKAIPPEFVSDGTEVMLAVATIRRAARGGPKTRGRLCARVAALAAADDRFAAFDTIELHRDRFDPVAYANRGERVADNQILASCPIPH